MKNILFLLFLLIATSIGAQAVNDSENKSNQRESVFSDDLKYVFVLRKENLGNVFIYDVVNNTMIKEIICTSGPVIKVIPREKYFLVATANALEVYDLKTFGKYYELPFDYSKIDNKTLATVPKAAKKKFSFKKEKPPIVLDWTSIEVIVGGDLVSCIWKDGKVKIWNWKKRQILLDVMCEETGNFDFSPIKITYGTNPARVLFQGRKELTLYDSTLKVLGKTQLKEKNSTSYYNDLTNEVMVNITDFQLTALKLKFTNNTYSADLSSVKNSKESEMKISLKTINIELGSYGENLISEKYENEIDFEKEYLKYNYNTHEVTIKNAQTGVTKFTFNGSYSSISPDGKYLILKTIKGDMPEYNVDKYKKFFKKRSKMLKGNRSLYKYKKEVDDITYQVIYNLETGKEVISLKTAAPVYYFRDIYILENSPDNGGLKLYDYNNGTLIKEI